jgi:hypothetical protein
MDSRSINEKQIGAGNIEIYSLHLRLPHAKTDN